MGSISLKDLELLPVLDSNSLIGFSCGNKDLDDFFANDAFLYAEQLLGKTYYFVTKGEKPKIVGAFTVANDSTKASLISSTTRNKIQRKIPNSKRTRSYPAILIGRLGVCSSLRGESLGSQILDYIKGWFFSPDNKSGCRFIVVDAYNIINENKEYRQSSVLQFYENNGFKYLYPSEEEEREVFGIADDAPLNTRLMYFDLLTLK